ncbi:ABC transporter ATP-binding protein [Microlunatus flavus]|uniref:ABC-2 type transport system ATP-binding protein n=1 Tax=Microlunatus flavus TaxID=1036181 RepID=A0A1H9H2W3_9ACTN|nr:ABC-2 type transport system ATP-binding protein [Microlunatus flavus]
MASPTAFALQVRDLTVRLGGTAVLDALSLTAADGALTAVLGPNGAGKTTLVRCCTGLVRPDAGEVAVLGRAPGSPDVTAAIGVMPQSTGAWSGIRAVELLRYLASLYAHPLDVDALVARLGIGAYARTPYRRLSGGQQQAVNLAGALVGRPSLVFLDEPTAGMDPHARRATWELLRELRAAGASVVLTTHAMDEAEALADQVWMIDRGRVAASGTVAELTTGGQTLEDVFLTRTHGVVG